MNRQARFALLAALGFLAALGCAAKDPGGAAVPGVPGLPGQSGPVVPLGEIPTDEEARQLANSLEAAFRNKQLAAMDQAFDATEFLRLSTGGLDASAQARDPFCQGAGKSLQQSGGPLRQAANKPPQWIDFQQLRIVTADGAKRLRFRAILENGGVAYMDLRVVRQPGGTVRYVDLFGFAAGEWMSQLLQREYLAARANDNRGLLERLTRSESDYVASLPQRKRMSEAVQQGDGKGALAAYAAMPASVQKTKTIMLLRMVAAQSLEESEYLAAMNDYMREFPDDAAIDMFGIDYAAVRKKHREVLRCVDRLDKAVGGDPYLSSIRASTYLELKEYAKAKEEANRQIAALPGIASGLWALVVASLAEKDFEETNRLAVRLAALGVVDAFPPVEDALYAEYRKSPQYSRLLKDHPELTPKKK